MNALLKPVTDRRVRRLATYLATLAAITACESPLAVNPVVPDTRAIEPAVTAHVSADFARAGEVIRLELVLSDRPHAESGAGVDRSATLRATVTWDADRFDYVEGQGAGSRRVLAGHPGDGFMTVEISGPEILRDGRVDLRFVALEDSNTSSFEADAILITSGDGQTGVVN